MKRKMEIGKIKMELYKQRILEEYKELKERTEKLGGVLTRAAYDELDFELTCPVELLQSQWHAMRAYLKILEVRAVIEGIKLND